MAKDLLTQDDREAMKEIASVLTERNLLDRFGVSLRHEHFPVEDDEAVHEVNDKLGRISLRRVLKHAELPEDAFPTEWALDTEGNAQPVAWCCD